jgi:hypothetical protein
MGPSFSSLPGGDPPGIRLRRLGAALVGCCVFGGAVVQGGTPRYTATRVAVTAMSERTSSSSYETLVTTSPVIGAVGSCPNGAVSTLGFWSILGPGEVPVVLQVARDQAVPSAVRLNWSGQAAEFIVFGSTSPVDLVDPANLVSTTKGCRHLDPPSVDAKLWFYRVVPSGGSFPRPEASR